MGEDFSGATTRRGALIALGVGAAACSQRPEAPAYQGGVRFAHGVASGDPGQDRVVIWTRVSPDLEGPAPVRWIVARNETLSDVVRTGVIETNASRDYTVKVDVMGLRPGAPYYYGFLIGDQASPVGRARTLARGRMNELKIAVASCASFPHGFFNAYEAIAQLEDVDIVLHLGDYIYEYGLSGYGGDTAIALGRVPRPEVECVSLADYRQRHAQAKGEAELQAAHARCPWIVVWDDHEIANDCWTGGAENHQDGEGDWQARKRAALQAYYEWMPIRDPEPGRAFEAVNRTFQFGDLLSLIMLETRLQARTAQFDYAREIPLVMQAWDFSNPLAPAPASANAAGPAIRVLPVPFEEIGDELRPVRDWRRVGPAVANPTRLPQGLRFMPDVARLSEALNDPARVLLGAEQELWLGQQLEAAKESKTAWTAFGNQVMMASVLAPDLSRTPPELASALEALRPGVSALLGFTRFEIPLNPDGWDGYPQARARVLDCIRKAGVNTVVFTGDSHAAWANEINDSDGRRAVEFGTTSITSPSDASYFARAGIDFGGALEARNANVKWTDQEHNGFLLATFKKDAMTAEFFIVTSVASKDFETRRVGAFTVVRSENGAIGAITPVET